MSTINDGGPAFPTGDNPESRLMAEPGMTLRDYFAIRAPEAEKWRIEQQQSTDKNRNPHNDSHKPKLRSEVEIRCDLAYQYADAMIQARGKA